MNRVKEARKVTWVGFAVNMVLTILKIIAGFLGKSTAMIADGIHSLSDFITDLFVIVFIGISGKEKDEDHRYGHGKYETFATLLISLALILVGIGIFWSGLSKIIQVVDGGVLEQPTYLALFAAVISIIFKEALFWYTKIVGDKIKSNAVIANAWHHRSDAFSSIGTALGISGAIFLGESWRILDPIAGVIVSFFILKVAFELGMPSVHELLEKSLPKETEKSIIDVIESHPDVIFQHNLKTRKIGNIFAIDVHIKLDKNISFVKSHDVATEIEVKLREKFGEKTVTSIHTEPYVKK
ncbi:MAG: cation diffusion facilitator family transporter [Paludibacter sp.]|jgi:cation diffusion facilitator family transporter|nr:cation diffusion facilitator family transporter [Paludibacter sp.]